MKHKSLKKCKIVWLVFLLIVVLALSGCVKIRRELVFNSNGMVTCNIDLKVQEELLTMSGTSKDEFFQTMSQGIDSVMKIKQTQESVDGKTWYGFGGTATLPSAMTDEIVAAMMGEEVVTSVTRTGFIVKTITIEMSKTPSNSTSSGQEDWSKYTEDLGRMGITDDFTIKVPYEIISTNGLLDAADNTRVTWDLYDFELGKTTQKTLTVTYINWLPIIIILILILVIFFIIAPAIIIPNAIKGARRKASKKNSLESYANNNFFGTYQPTYPSQPTYPTQPMYTPGANYQGFYGQNQKECVSYGNTNIEYYYNAQSNSSMRTETYGSTVVESNNLVTVEEKSQSVIDTDAIAQNTTPSTEEKTVDPKEEILKLYGPGGSFYKK